MAPIADQSGIHAGDADNAPASRAQDYASGAVMVMPKSTMFRLPADVGAEAARERAALAAADSRLSVCLMTETAYRAPPALSIIAAMSARISFLRDLSERMETALHEAIANAVIHGNLAIADLPRDNLDDCATREQALECAAAMPDRSRRLIMVTAQWDATEIELTVEDQGDGYDQALRPADRPFHGLALIQALADRTSTSDHGRRLSMFFKR